MASFFNLTLDTTGPASPTMLISGGATYATALLVTLTLGTTDAPTTGYQMKIWGAGIDTTNDTNIKATEGESTWITYATSKQVKLSAGDGSKDISFKIRDDVYNESSIISQSIILDMSLPIVTITGPDLSKISKVAGKNVSSFSFQSDTEFTEYIVKVVGSSGADHSTGTQIGTANGSTNMGTTGTFPSATPITCTINGADLELASSGDAQKIIKVFVKDAALNWSV